jgi:hypothetical protein
MVRFYSRAAKRNLKAGSKKMEDNMSAAARVRREFRLGRPPKTVPEGMPPMPLHPQVAADKAVRLLADLRERMHAAGLKREEVDGVIVGIRAANPDEPVFIPIDRAKAIETLSAPDIIALGCVFRQHDGDKDFDFPVQFAGLNARGVGVLRRAVEIKHAERMGLIRTGVN